MQRVVITGMGGVASLGHNANEIWSAMVEGRSGIGLISNIPTDGLNVRIAAEVKDFKPQTHFEDRRLITLDRVSQFALVAAREAVLQSNLNFADNELGEYSAIVLGTGGGGENTRDDQYRQIYLEKKQRVHPMTIVRLMPSAPASQLSMEFGVTGPTFCVTSACASANHALVQAFRMVRSGEVKVALAGGCEAFLSFGPLKAWEAMRVLADDTCRPFSAHRRGVVLGEGAGIFVLESYEHAQLRDAPILAELVGAGVSADASDLVFPSENGAARAIEKALLDGGIEPSSVDYINAHGTGTHANDVTESKAIRRVFGEHADRLAVSSTKSMHGHAMGASGAIELMAVIGALQYGVIPPTMNYLEADPACDLDYVPNVARKARVETALSNSFAFGGLNAVLALRHAP